ncbi:MAG: hypothetical protein J5678_00930 [Bacteroidaceae bacterium]|nr:hypothetical protein [Bacteroidaceae bacterium]
MTHNDISQLIERFLNAQTTEAEEQQLAEYFSSADNVPQEWQPIQELFRSFQTDAYDLTDAELTALTAEPAAPKRKPVVMYWLYAAAACAAILFIIGSALLYNNVQEEKLAGNGKVPVINQRPTPKVIDHKIASITDNESKSPQSLKALRPQKHKAATVNSQSDSELLAVNEAELPIADPQQEMVNEMTEPQLAMVSEPETQPEPQMAVCSETDIPITNPQNLVYTEEDIQILFTIYKQRFLAEMQDKVNTTRYNLKKLEYLLADK